eukprot:scaffold574840_cov15-Prasinocladus_malaysianus.AAC.1
MQFTPNAPSRPVPYEQVVGSTRTRSPWYQIVATAIAFATLWAAKVAQQHRWRLATIVSLKAKPFTLDLCIISGQDNTSHIPELLFADDAVA